MKTIETITYEAFDGTIFDDYRECANYERSQMDKIGIIMYNHKLEKTYEFDDIYVICFRTIYAFERFKTIYELTTDECLFEYVKEPNTYYIYNELFERFMNKEQFIQEVLDTYDYTKYLEQLPTVEGE